MPRTPISRLELVTPLSHGVSERVLARGAGHYLRTRLPGQGGTIAVAGHRVTNTRPFLGINALRRNDRILVDAGGERFVYAVSGMRIVRPTEVWVLRDRGFEQLVLTACHPPRTARFRIVVFARRIG